PRMLAVIDYGVANIGSLMTRLRKCGLPAEPVSTMAEVARAERLILPGVGSFDNGMAHLGAHGLVEILRETARAGEVPVLGICLGMQLLGEGSEEGEREGLGIVRGGSQRLRLPPQSGLKVPHQGWCHLELRRPSPLLTEVGPRTRFYFSHSYHLVCADDVDVLAVAQHGAAFTAMVQRGSVYGAQFHPEKSHRYGMELLRNFAGIVV
ncbi:MAG: imidazole glycerol phosphate synthase subunit HisH, partial [Gemmatimonadaceae bacterium]|nr:imidazole glycerol phosphate synthase subunit HisH [Gemmatimonadaceae bacterium]